MLSMIGLIGGLVLLIILTSENEFIYQRTLCAVVVALCSGIPLFTGEVNFVSAYMDGFASLATAWFFISGSVRCSANLWKIPAPPTASLSGSLMLGRKQTAWRWC